MFSSTDFCTQSIDALGADVELTFHRMSPRKVGLVPLLLEGSVDDLESTKTAGVVAIR